MSLKVSFTHPHFDKGTEVDLTGVGLIKNGGSKTLNEEEERAAVARLGMGVKEYFKDSEQVKVEGTTELKSTEVETLTEGGGEV